jgi:dihydropteroate synthase
MVWQTLGISPNDALNGTSVLNTIALLNGADIIRVHDVLEAKQVVDLVSKYKEIIK